MPRFEIRRSTDAKFYFVELADNGQVLTTSETYDRLQSALDGAHAAGATEGTLEYAGIDQDPATGDGDAA